VGSYKVVFRPSVEKDLAALPKATARRALARIEKLAENPFASAIKLSGAEKLYRVRVGDYRIVYEIDAASKLIVIHYVRHRRDVYRSL
jgi:mRNA interferase RelE/StbE